MALNPPPTPIVVPQVSDPSFTPPVIPRVDNSTGLPNTPTSGWNVVSPQAQFIETGPDWSPQHPAGAGSNVGDSPQTPSGTHESLGARAGALLGRVFGRDRGSEF